MNVGFIGAGKMASILMEKVDESDRATITGVCDVDEGPRKRPPNRAGRRRTPITERSTTRNASMRCSSPFAYDDQVTLAAERGIDVFVEKPVALETAQGRETVAAIESAGIVAGTGYVFRYDEITDRTVELLADRDVSLFTGRYWSGLLASAWGNELALSGGEIVIRTTHLYDLIRYLGGEIDRITAASTDRINTPEIDYPDATTAS